MSDDNEVIWPGRLSMQGLMDLMETDPATYWAQYMQSPSQSGRAYLMFETAGERGRILNRLLTKFGNITKKELDQNE